MKDPSYADALHVADDAIQKYGDAAETVLLLLAQQSRSRERVKLYQLARKSIRDGTRP